MLKLYVCRSFCLLVTTVKLAKTAEPITMPFQVLIHVGQRTNYALDGGSDPTVGKVTFWGMMLEFPHKMVSNVLIYTVRYHNKFSPIKNPPHHDATISDVHRTVFGDITSSEKEEKGSR